MNARHKSPAVRFLAIASCLVMFQAGLGITATEPEPLIVVVMDPLAKPLSCPCVQGYAQRDYDKLAASLSKKLNRPVKTYFKESLTAAMQRDTKGIAHLVIGKKSVVEYDARQAKLQIKPIGRLTAKDGSTTMTGLFVVPTEAPAKTLSDIQGYSIVFGPEECDEKHAAALQALAQHQIAVPQQLDTAIACDEGAIRILEEAKLGKHGVAVISSYAKPLLEGCGTIEKGALRVVGETAPVPFVEAFLSDQLSATDQQTVADALMAIMQDPQLRIAMETQKGFITADQPTTIVKKN